MRRAVRDDGLRGTFFVPAGGGVHPGAIVVGGSGGGLQEGDAALLASRGIAALALAYFAYSATVEERLLGESFPEAYPRYRAHTKMLIPYVL